MDEMFSEVGTDMLYDYNRDKQRILMTFESGDSIYRIHFGINGFNGLPNFVGIDRSSNGTDWVTINSAATDWLPPLRVAAVSNGDGSGKYATGGNHGNVDKTARGDRTALNKLFQVRADGEMLEASRSANVETIDILISNDIMGWNTTLHQPRYIMRQTFNLSFRAGSCEVQAHLEALEDVLLARDSALQCVTVGFQEQLCFYGKSVRQPYVNGMSSGSKGSAPDVMGVGLFSEENGQMVMWLDRHWEAGEGDMLHNDHPLVRISGNKAYLAVALDVDEDQHDIKTTVALKAGQSYRYRGGYSWQATANHSGIDSSFYYHINGKSHYAFVTGDGKLVTV
ncbi:hypothetical protein FE783_35470 [Paenibacillus mesophilus]|uniref:hypothetical protein n=1 Tax=Paenibacillus mesophilus TaxID=2582849 RepID=UPI00110E865E|nr:hypothetical protein [Paenibacillus mesophilus]TMV43334.1 hypothetical protein FE783_35470 [Paenibacillus mesophilus]